MSMMQQQQPEPESEWVSGQIAGIIQKGADKWQVAVKTDPSSQYSRNLWTKDQALVGQLSTMIGQMMTFECGVSHWTNQQNQPVRSLWINGVGPMGQQPMQQQPTFTPQPQQQPQWGQPQMAGPNQVLPQAQAQPAWDGDDPKQGKIHRQTATKVAVHLLDLLPENERTLDTLLTLSERLVAYYDYGLPQGQSNGPSPAAFQGDAYGGDPGPQFDETGHPAQHGW